VRCGDEVLLLKGAPHKRLWANRYNGLGGHIEAGEDVLSSARRELREEAGIDAHDLRLAAVIHADAGDPVLGVLVFVFTAYASDKVVTESSEGSLEWFPIADLPVAAMAPDLPAILPRILALPDAAPPLFLAYSYDEYDRLVIRFAETD
jgi:8-oxo-dGTP diphosphatase